MNNEQTGQELLSLFQKLDNLPTKTPQQMRLLNICRQNLAMFNIDAKGNTTIKRTILGTQKAKPQPQPEPEPQPENTVLLADNSDKGLAEIETRRRRKKKDNADSQD